MDNSTRHFKVRSLALVALMSTTAFSCTAEEAAPPEEVAPPEAAPSADDVAAGSEALRIESGELSRKLGVNHWEVAEGLSRGVNDEGVVVVEFHVDPATDLIHSVFPASGSITLRGDLADSTLREDVYRYFEVMRLDFNALLAQNAAELVSGMCAQCLSACVSGTAAIQAFCPTIPIPQIRAACWAVQFAGPVVCQGFCYWYLCP